MTSATLENVPETSNDIVRMLIQQVVDGVNAINEANKVLLAETEQGSGVREIDKALKDFVKSDTNDVSEKNQDVVKAVAALERTRKAFKKAQEEARNAYRTNILGEEAQTESDEEVDTEQVKQQRKLVVGAVGLLKDFAETNSLPEVEKWANELQIPQVGRQGSSAVGQKKPRAFVTVAGTTHNSFGEAAKALSEKLSTDEAKVEVTSGDLVSAWDEAGADEFEFNGVNVKVAQKQTGKAAA